MNHEYQGAATEAVVYYQITLAVHVDLAGGRVERVVELGDEIHLRECDRPMQVEDDRLIECSPEAASRAREIAEAAPWPAPWDFGY